MKGRIDIEEGSLIALVIFTLMAIFIKGGGRDTQVLTLLSVATFLYGMFISFIFGSRHNRLNNLKSVLRSDDARYLNIYKFSEVFGKKVQKKVQTLIDNYFTSTIDYDLPEYYLAGPEFLKLFDYIKNLKPKTKAQDKVHSELLDIVQDANLNRKSVEQIALSKMLPFKWVTLLSLLSVILFSLFYVNNNSIASIFITVLLATASVIMILVLRDIDSLMWKEEEWVWLPLDVVFGEMDLLPYYPDYMLSTERRRLPKGTKLRIANYSNKYPDMSGKKVKVVTI
jgi:hypothetical protein